MTDEPHTDAPGVKQPTPATFQSIPAAELNAATKSFRQALHAPSDGLPSDGIEEAEKKSATPIMIDGKVLGYVVQPKELSDQPAKLYLDDKNAGVSITNAGADVKLTFQLKNSSNKSEILLPKISTASSSKSGDIMQRKPTLECHFANLSFQNHQLLDNSKYDGSRNSEPLLITIESGTPHIKHSIETSNIFTRIDADRETSNGVHVEFSSLDPVRSILVGQYTDNPYMKVAQNRPTDLDFPSAEVFVQSDNPPNVFLSSGANKASLAVNGALCDDTHINSEMNRATKPSRPVPVMER